MWHVTFYFNIVLVNGVKGGEGRQCSLEFDMTASSRDECALKVVDVINQIVPGNEGGTILITPGLGNVDEVPF